ncbi:MAG: sulfur carrier protein ThiS adenylyltransferase ThiF [Mailhella sp.]|nr:sulfur carrier protein ThiS adenylyltransferase ThiF [Mailhella sp.]
MLSYFSPEQRQKLASARVGLAGTGGLGSNAAMMLARCGVGRLILIDADKVEASNLNRQHYFPRHLGMPKVKALADQLRELCPAPEVETLTLWLEDGNIAALLDKADVWLECLDDARLKARFTAMALSAGRTVVSASGMGGFGGFAMTRRVMKSASGLLAAVGDFRSGVDSLPPLAPRVMQCAAMQADAALEFILTGNIKPLL